MKHTDEEMRDLNRETVLPSGAQGPHKLVLGVTGGVGAGKSTILSYLSDQYHACVIEMDEVGKELQEPGQRVYEQMVDLFGREILNEDGSLSRQLVAARIFEDVSLRDKLNRIVHPAVWDEVNRRIYEAQHFDEYRLIVVESALLIDAGYERVVDEVWYIYTDQEVRKMRLKRDRGYSDEKCEAIFASQRDDAFFRAHAGYVIDNSSDNVNNTFKQIDEGMNRHGIL